MRSLIPAAGLVALGSLLYLPACGGAPKPVLAQVPSVEGVEEGQATCKVAKDPLNPLIVEWPGTSKVSLDSQSQKGLVVVSYVGCVLKVLTSCQAGGAYDLKPVTPVRDKVSIENETELYARLPLGVASLKGELSTAQRLDLEYVAIGQREAAKPPVSLSGECAGATHYVRSIMVGAYGLDAVGKGKVAGGATVGESGAGGERSESVRRLRGSGDVVKCAVAGAKVEDCGAVLQLGLAPLAVSGGAVTAGGFGAGLGAVTVVPTVREVTTLDGGVASLAKADVALLGVLQEAKRADKAPGAFEQKAAAWAKLAAYTGENPYKELAEKRRDEWTRAAEAEARRKEQVAKVCRQHATDSAKLAELVRLDDDVVTPKQKAAYRAELAQVYAPYAEALEECKRQEAEASRQALAEASAQQRNAEEAQRRAAAAARCRQFAVEDPGSGAGTGSVRDASTGLTWLRYESRSSNLATAKEFCASKGMRLPTYDEAKHIAVGDSCPNLWGVWDTWTLPLADEGPPASAYIVERDGSRRERKVTLEVGGALCVR